MIRLKLLFATLSAFVGMVAGMLREAASPPPITDVTSALTTGLSTTATNAMSVISTILPYALAIVGAVIVITLGIKVFRRISGR